MVVCASLGKGLTTEERPRTDSPQFFSAGSGKLGHANSPYRSSDGPSISRVLFCKRVNSLTKALPSCKSKMGGDTRHSPGVTSLARSQKHGAREEKEKHKLANRTQMLQ